MAEAAILKPGFHQFEVNKGVWDLPVRYNDVQALGSGAFGQVSSAFDQERKTRVAVKKLTRPFQSVVHAKRAFREIRMLKHMHHDNIIGLLDLFTPGNGPEDFKDVYMVTHLMGTDLHNIINTGQYNEDHIRFFVYQILRGLKYIHSAGIIHRDLKPNNVAVNEDCDLRILDFGLARHMAEEMTGYVVMRWYRAPEIILNWTHYNQTADIWSVGCIMAELITKRPMFRGTNHINQLEKIMKLVGTPSAQLLGKISSVEAINYVKSMGVREKKDFKTFFRISSLEGISLLERMLDLDPDTRITAEEALAHPYMKIYADPEDEPESEPYDQSFETNDADIDTWKKLIYDEIQSFEPPTLEEMES